jgi:hypothetical protein
LPFPAPDRTATLDVMKRNLCLLAALLFAACSAGQKHAWKQSGESWSDSGKQTLRALGESVDPDATDRKGEWKQVGREFGEAGKDTGRAISKSIDPD